MTDSLKQIFAEHGKIVSVFVKIDILRKSPYGFVCFESNEDAKKAMQAYLHLYPSVFRKISVILLILENRFMSHGPKQRKIE